MVTYLQLGSEQVWHDQIVPPFMTGFLIVPLRNFYGLDANAVGAPGDNNHLYGRHRSANWDRTSRYCTDRSYGTVDARDHQGDQDWYRAVDTGIQGDVLHAASHRMDAAVRAGELPEVAEWFGSFDGVNVVGWYEGHPSSSDSSHLYHLHVGFWNQYANDFAVMQRVFAVITGQELDMASEWHTGDANGSALTQGSAGYAGQQRDTALAFAWQAAHEANEKADQALAALAEIKTMIAALAPGNVELTPEQVAQISGAAHDGAASAIDGATISSATISTAH